MPFISTYTFPQALVLVFCLRGRIKIKEDYLIVHGSVLDACPGLILDLSVGMLMVFPNHLNVYPNRVTWSFFRDSAMQAIPAQLAGNHDDPHATRYGEETANKQVKFRVPVSNSEMDDPDAEEQSERDHSSNWPAGHTAYTSTLDDPNSSYSPYLAPVLEEPSSSFSEGNVLLHFKA